MRLYGPFLVLFAAVPMALKAGNLSIGLGFAVYGLLRVGHIRNTRFALSAGFIVALLAWYSSWVALAQALVTDHPWLWHPGDLFAFAQAVAEHGRWEKGGQPIPAIVTWSVWGIEALMFLAVITILPWDYLRNLPYCEDCDCRLDANTGIGPFAPGGDSYAIRSEIERGDLRSLLALGPTQDPPYWELQLRYCGKCENQYLANLVRITHNEEGEPRRHTLIRNFYVSREEYDCLWDLDKPDVLRQGG